MKQTNPPNPKIFYQTVIWLVAAFLFLKLVIPVLSKVIVGHQNLLPIPGALMMMYMALVGTGAVVFISSNDERLRGFLIPIVQLLRGEAPPILRWAVLIIFPLFVGWIVYSQAAPKVKSPTAIRIQHPTIPQKFERLENPYRNPTDAQVQQFIAEAGLGEVSLEEARAQLVEEYTTEGRDLYQTNCRPCHGTKADGEGPMARGLRLKPANFSSTDTIATVVESYVFWRINEGGVGLPPEASPWDSAMPRWRGDLTEEQMWKIILAEYETAGVEPRQPEKLH
jgi:mono/diheme cytochrome c family protein